MFFLGDSSFRRRWMQVILVLMARVAQHWPAAALAAWMRSLRSPRVATTGLDGKSTTATVRIMGRLGLFYVTAIITILSAVFSAFVAWLFSFVVDVPAYHVYIRLAFVIPFFVTPFFSYLAALSMRDLQRARKKAVDLAWMDMLTGLGNRRAFFDTARRAGNAGAQRTSRAVLYIDIDHFKIINDRYGHDAGDAVLKHFAGLLRDCTRAEDFVARIGGEEFAVHVVNIEPTGLAAIAQGLLARVRASAVDFGGVTIRYTASIGGAVADPALPIDKLLSLADKQLYAVKHAGRDGYRAVDARKSVVDQPAGAAQPEARHIQRLAG